MIRNTVLGRGSIFGFPIHGDYCHNYTNPQYRYLNSLTPKLEPNLKPEPILPCRTYRLASHLLCGIGKGRLVVLFDHPGYAEVRGLGGYGGLLIWTHKRI